MCLELSQPLRPQHCRQTLPVDIHLLLLMQPCPVWTCQTGSSAASLRLQNRPISHQELQVIEAQPARYGAWVACGREHLTVSREFPLWKTHQRDAAAYRS